MKLLLFSCQVMSNSLRPHGLQNARFLYPSPSPGVCPSSCPLNQWRHPTVLSSVTLFSFCPQSFPYIIGKLQTETLAWARNRRTCERLLRWLSPRSLTQDPCSWRIPRVELHHLRQISENVFVSITQHRIFCSLGDICNLLDFRFPSQCLRPRWLWAPPQRVFLCLLHTTSAGTLQPVCRIVELQTWRGCSLQV